MRDIGWLYICVWFEFNLQLSLTIVDTTNWTHVYTSIVSFGQRQKPTTCCPRRIIITRPNCGLGGQKCKANYGDCVNRTTSDFGLPCADVLRSTCAILVSSAHQYGRRQATSWQWREGDDNCKTGQGKLNSPLVWERFFFCQNELLPSVWQEKRVRVSCVLFVVVLTYYFAFTVVMIMQCR